MRRRERDTHPCPVCGRRVPTDRFLCPGHWAALPSRDKQRVNKAWRQYRRDLAEPAGPDRVVRLRMAIADLRAAQSAALAALGVTEHDRPGAS